VDTFQSLTISTVLRSIQLLLLPVVRDEAREFWVHASPHLAYGSKKSLTGKNFTERLFRPNLDSKVHILRSEVSMTDCAHQGGTSMLLQRFASIQWSAEQAAGKLKRKPQSAY
jgi:hypothetical protein